MFGHNPRLRRQLEKNGQRAQATVLSATRTRWTETQGTDVDIEVLYKLLVRIEPDDQPAFEARVEELFPYTWSPAPGGRFPVLYDSTDHSKVLIDHSDQGKQQLTQRMNSERATARIDRMRARGQNDIADRLQSVADLPAADSSDPAERQAQSAARQDQIRAVMAGPHVLVDGQPVGDARGSVAATATAAALTQLAALHDRGVLTDAEFQTQKMKVLNA